jgi:hypothetical protein
MHRYVEQIRNTNELYKILHLNEVYRVGPVPIVYLIIAFTEVSFNFGAPFLSGVPLSSHLRHRTPASAVVPCDTSNKWHNLS